MDRGTVLPSQPLVSNEYETEPTTSTGMRAEVPFSGFVFGPKDIMPFPKSKKTTRTNAKRGKTVIITSSPYRQELETAQNKQANKIKKSFNFKKDTKPLKAQNIQKEEKQKGTKSAKRVQAETEIEKKKNREERSENRQEISKKGKSSKNSDVKRSTTKKKDSSYDEDDAECLYCFGLYSESSEGWVQCPSCRLWACCACAEVEDEDAETVFLCENCED